MHKGHILCYTPPPVTPFIINMSENPFPFLTLGPVSLSLSLPRSPFLLALSLSASDTNMRHAIKSRRGRKYRMTDCEIEIPPAAAAEAQSLDMTNSVRNSLFR